MRKTPYTNLRTLLVSMAACGLLIVNTPSQAAVLDFNYHTTQVATSNQFGVGPFTQLGSAGWISQNYGDVAGLLDVSYRYFNSLNQHVSSLQTWEFNYDELEYVAWTGSNGGGDRAEVELASVNGSLVMLNSFRLGSWSTVGKEETVRVFEIGNNTPILDFTGLIGVNNLSNLFNINASSTSGFLIEWTNPWWTAIDSVEHTVVPVPASVWLFASAIAGFVGLRRRA